MEFIKANIKIITGSIILLILGIITLFLFFTNGESENTNEENTPETTSETITEEERTENDSQLAIEPMNNVVNTKDIQTHFDWEPSKDLVFIHPESDTIARESFDNDNEQPYDDAKELATEDCTKLGGSISSSSTRIMGDAEVKFTCSM